MSDDTFRVDNSTLEHLRNFGRNTPKPGQMYLPGMEPLGPFDLWLTLGCYFLIDPKKPTAPVFMDLSSILRTLDFSQTLAKATGDYQWLTFSSDDYVRIKEAFHRLRTVEFPIWGYLNFAAKGKSRRSRKLVESHAGILASYGYYYPADVIPPDQLPEGKRRNVNQALTYTNETGPAIFQRTDVKPEGVFFQMSEPVVRGLMEGETRHIGATILPVEVFQFRNQLSRNLTATKLLLRTCRQTSKKWTIGLDKLVAQAGLGETRNVGRDRQAALDAVGLLAKLGVVEGFHHDPKTDKVVILKSNKWHFPRANRGELEDFIESSTG